MYLILAGIFEMLGVTWINKWHRDKNRRALLLLAGGFMASFMFLSLAMRTLPASTAYAVWTGIGASGAALWGMIKYGESRDFKRIFFIAVIVAATMGLKWIE